VPSMEKIVHNKDAYKEVHVLYWNVDGDLFHDKTLKKKAYCPIHTRTQMWIDWERQPCYDELTLIRKHMHCSKCDMLNM
jgi:hypothetical protein